MSVHLMGLYLTGVHLTSVYLTGVPLTSVHLTYMNVTSVYLIGGCLMSVHFVGVHLTGVHLARVSIPMQKSEIRKASGIRPISIGLTFEAWVETISKMAAVQTEGCYD